MKYQIFDIGTQVGSLQNSITVPDAYSVISTSSCVKAIAEAPNQPPAANRRTARPPAGWTPEGGPADFVTIR